MCPSKYFFLSILSVFYVLTYPATYTPICSGSSNSPKFTSHWNPDCDLFRNNLCGGRNYFGWGRAWLGSALRSMTNVLMRTGERTRRHAEERRPRQDERRDASRGGQPLGAGTDPPSGFRQEPALPTPWLCISGLQSCERIHFHCLKPLSLR